VPTKFAEVKKLLELGADNYNQIALAVGCTRGYVSKIAIYEMGRKKQNPYQRKDRNKSTRDPILLMLAEAFDKSGLSYRALEKKSGVGKSQIQRWFDKTQSPSLPSVVAVAEALGLRLTLLPIHDEKNKPVRTRESVRSVVERAWDDYDRRVGSRG